MNRLRRNRLIWSLAALVLAAVLLGLVLTALRENINLFYTPSQVIAREAPVGERIRIGGMVVKDSLEYATENAQVTFWITDFSHQTRVLYTGILPDLFTEGQGMVATGFIRNGVFEAEEILAKHDENYQPPELDAIKKTK